MHHDFDLIVIGGGSGGLAGAFRAAALGAKVALLEPQWLGGTCVNVGCVPKKAMWLAADMGAKLGLARELGFAMEPARLDWKVFIAHRQRYINNIHASYRKRLDEAGIVVLPVRARLVDASTVECSDGVRLRGKRLLIATGGRPARPQIRGAELGGVSDDFFHWVAPPGRVALVGGGYIAMELAGMLQALGSRVDVFVAIHMDCEVTALEQGADGAGVVVRGNGTPESSCDHAFDQVLFATGRRPNTDALGLEAAGVAVDDKGHVRVDRRHATNVDEVFAVGDVTGDLALTPIAIAAARRLMDRLYGGQDKPLDQSNVPTVLFSHPPLGMVGLSEAQAREQYGDDVHIARSNFRPMLHALADVPQRSLFKLVCVGSERRVVGIHLLGEGADEILQGFAVALRLGMTLADLHDTVAIHPTSAEEVVLMR